VTRARPLRVAVDLTAVLPGGENGGAKTLTLALLESMGRLAPQHRYLLLTARDSHHEFAHLEPMGMERRCVLEWRGAPAGTPPEEQPLRPGDHRARVLRALRPFIPRGVRRAGNRIWSRVTGEGRAAYGEPDPRNRGLTEEGIDVLFCPFTAPVLAEPDVPVVSVVYDLQHLAYPQFFAAAERANRDALLRVLERRADRVVCISEHAQRGFIAHLDLPAERTVTIPIAAHGRLPRLPADETKATLARLGLDRPYALYPANFWPHKNHRMLLVAFARLRADRPELDLDLALTGALPQAARELEEAARAMGLGQRVRFLGYLPDRDLAALYEGCRLVVFPSLYEGYGMPVLEAMHFGRPICCSRVTSLPEVAGEAALFFDPRRPQEIAGAMRRLLDDPALEAELVARGRARLEAIDPDAMARAYLDVFSDAAGTSDRASEGLHGMFPDGWMGGRAWVVPGTGHRACELSLYAAPWLRTRGVTVTAHRAGGQAAGEWRIARGARATVSIPLDGEKERVQLRLAPIFRPSEHGLGPDQRLLSCQCEGFRLVD
jgi:glycosyltransferase involved in cell wall biosynthesis